MAKLPKITGRDDGSSKEWRELAPKMPDGEFIPEGAITFHEFRDRLGKAMFPDDWTGEECVGGFAGSFGSVHRSEAERDADRSRRRAQAVKRYECAGLPVPPSLRSDDADENTDDSIDERLSAIHIFAPLTGEQIEAIDRDLKPVYDKALAVKGRRERVEAVLREIFWSGTLGTFYISQDGQKRDVAPNDWGVNRESGKSLLDETTLEAGFFLVKFSDERRRCTILIDAEEAKTVLSTYEAGEARPESEPLENRNPKEDEPKPPPLLSADVTKNYLARVKGYRKKYDRRPTIAEDEEWRIAEGISRPRMRELRKEARLPDEEKGGAPKRKNN